jgi:hypothetical protein
LGLISILYSYEIVNDMCPEDTIPITRTKEDDVSTATSVKRHGKKKHTSIIVPRIIPKYAVGEMYLFNKHHDNRLWASLFLMVC